MMMGSTRRHLPGGAIAPLCFLLALLLIVRVPTVAARGNNFMLTSGCYRDLRYNPETYDFLSCGDENKGLTGTIGAEIGDYSLLTYLGLGGQRNLEGSLPPDLGALTNLQALYVDRCDINGTIPDELGMLTLLTDLVLHTNKLTGTIPPALGDLTELVRLKLYGNKLSGSIPVELMKLTKLEELQLHENALTGTIAPEMGALTKLRFVGLDKNQLTGAIPDSLAKLTDLSQLLLQHNHLVGRRDDFVARLRTEKHNASAVIGTSDNADLDLSIGL